MTDSTNPSNSFACMRTPRLLLLGGDGQVGWQLRRSLATLGELIVPTQAECDFTQLDAVRRTVRDYAPNIIVNAAAYTAVDKAESEPELAFRINAEAVAILAEEAKRQNALLVHYSTDYIFDGKKTAPYVETNAPNPQSVYGRSKWQGDAAIKDIAPDALIFRVSWVFGEYGANFVKTILRLAAERDTLRVVDDQVGSPTPAAFIADATAQILTLARQRRIVRNFSGTHCYHLTPTNPVSWCGFARAIVATAREIPGFRLKLAPEAIEAIPASEYPLPAPRPANSRLDCSRIKADFGIHQPDWQPYLERMLTLLSLSLPSSP